MASFNEVVDCMISIVALKFLLYNPSDYIVRQTVIHLIIIVPTTTTLYFNKNKTKYRSKPQIT